MNRKYPNICYFCGMVLDKTTTTKEHVPPKCFFPKGQKVDLITVPSCKEHNGGKSNDDEYLWQMISINIFTNDEGQKIATNKSVDAVLRNRKLTAELAKNSHHIYVKHQYESHFLPTYGFEVDFQRIDNIISTIAKALYFHEFHKAFFGDITIFNENVIFINSRYCNFYNQKMEEKRAFIRQRFLNIQKQGKNKKIFYYQMIQSNPNKIAIRLCFYGESFFTIILIGNQK